MLAEAPRVVQEGLLYPYIEGAGYVVEVWRSADGRPSPLDEWLPYSTEQVSVPEKRLGPEPDHPVRVRFEDEQVVYQNNLGRAETGIVFSEWADDDSGRGLAEGWAGDQFALYGEPGAWSLRWVMLWDDVAARDRAWGAFAGFSNRPPGMVVEEGEHGGRPSLVFLVGDPPESPLRFETDPGASDR